MIDLVVRQDDFVLAAGGGLATCDERRAIPQSFAHDLIEIRLSLPWDSAGLSFETDGEGSILFSTVDRDMTRGLLREIEREVERIRARPRWASVIRKTTVKAISTDGDALVVRVELTVGTDVIETLARIGG